MENTCNSGQYPRGAALSQALLKLVNFNDAHVAVHNRPQPAYEKACPCATRLLICGGLACARVALDATPVIEWKLTGHRECPKLSEMAPCDRDASQPCACSHAFNNQPVSLPLQRVSENSPHLIQ